MKPNKLKSLLRDIDNLSKEYISPTITNKTKEVVQNIEDLENVMVGCHSDASMVICSSSKNWYLTITEHNVYYFDADTRIQEQRSHSDYMDILNKYINIKDE